MEQHLQAQCLKNLCKRMASDINSPPYPYHPASNGLAERAVQMIKVGLKKATKGELETRLAQFLFQYQITPHSTTGISPANYLWVGNQNHTWIC